MIGLALCAGIAWFAYRLAGPNGGDKGDSAGLTVTLLLGLFFAGIFVIPAVLGGLLIGYGNKQNSQHKTPAVLGGALCLGFLAFLGLVSLASLAGF